MVKKGKNTYVPPKLLDEVDNIMKEKGYSSKSVAMNELVTYSRIGRELERINPLLWRRGRK